MRFDDQPPSYAPVVHLDRAALHDNVAAALADTGGPRFVDVRRNGWGHGRAFVAATAIAAGADAVIAEPGVDPAELGVAEAHVRVDPEGAIDPFQVFGMPDADGMLRGRPVMSLHGRVLAVKKLRHGEGVSYGYSYRAPADTRVALVTGGYGQGVVRILGNRVSVSIRGRSYPIVGRVAMDVCMLEIGDAELARGDRVTFFGDPRTGAPSIAAWVAASELTAPEILSVVGRRAAAATVIP